MQLALLLKASAGYEDPKYHEDRCSLASFRSGIRAEEIVSLIRKAQGSPFYNIRGMS